MSLRFLFALSLALHLAIGLRIVPHLASPFGGLFALLLAVSALSVPLGMIARRLARGPASDRLAWAGYLALGLFSSLFVLTLAREAVLAGAWVLGAAGLDIDREALRMGSAEAVPVVGGLLTLLGLWNARRVPAVVRVDVPIAGLPAAFEGFRIAQISDIHIGPTIKGPYLAAIVDKVNALGADAVAVTGDLVDGSVADLAAHVAPLARLTAVHGSYFVTGNHEYYSGAAPWLRELRRLGLNVLLNEHVVIRRGESALVLAGVTDYTAHHFDASHASDPGKALQGAPLHAPRVLLAHQPRSAKAAAEAGFDLQLSGHTHGGQFLPWNLFVPLQQPYTAGLHRHGSLWVYVSRGQGIGALRSEWALPLKSPR